MIFNPVVVGGGKQTSKFTFSSEDSSGQTLNGEPIKVGDTVELENGSINVLYASSDGSYGVFTGENHEQIPLIQSSSPLTTRATMYQYIKFVMPNEDCYFGWQH